MNTKIFFTSLIKRPVFDKVNSQPFYLFGKQSRNVCCITKLHNNRLLLASPNKDRFKGFIRFKSTEAPKKAKIIVNRVYFFLSWVPHRIAFRFMHSF
jgi:hypothetical protein